MRVAVNAVRLLARLFAGVSAHMFISGCEEQQGVGGVLVVGLGFVSGA